MVQVMRRLAPLVLVLACFLPATADAAKKSGRSADLWATVNVCDTPAQANTIGIRASMPGNGSSQRMYMRFEAQWFSSSKNRFVPTGSSSRWISAGSARYRSSQLGFSFQFDTPPAGASFLMRGKVDYQWRARRKGGTVVVLQRTRYTKAGVTGVVGGDPPGRSEA